MLEQGVILASRRWRIPLLIASIYAIVGVSYILISDLLLAGSAAASSEFAFWGMFKGVCYVLVTGVLLFWLVHRCCAHLELVNAAALRRAEQQAVIADIGQRAIEGTPAGRLIDEAPKHAARELGAAFGALLELSPDGETLLLRSGHNLRPELVGQLRLSATVNSQSAYTLQVNEPVIVANYARDGRFEPSPLALELGVVSSVTVVLRGRERPLGVLGIYSQQPRQYSADDCSFMRALANVISHAVERERADEALRRQNELLRSVTDNAPMLLGLLDAGGRLVWCNREWSRLSGASPGQPIDGLDSLFRAERERGTVRQQLQAAAGRWIDFQLRLADGRVLDTVWSSTPLSDQAMLCIGTDVTERRKLQEQLIQTQKLEAVGLLAAGIAHDFNNLLTAFLGYADLIRQQITANPPNLSAAGDSLEMIDRTAQRAAALTRQILIYCRRDVSVPAVVDPAVVVREMLPMLCRVLGEHIRVDSASSEAAPTVRIDPGRLEQTVMNLAINARDAMSAGGTLTIETGSGSPPISAGQSEAVGAAAHPWARIVVRDTGAGIAPEVRTRIFEPFFTTKPPGTGTGMGLATVKHIVDEAGGRIEVESRIDAGTTVTLWFPPASAAATADAPPDTTKPPRGRGETVLLCEDDDSLRDLAARAMDSAGYQVLSARTPERALELARRSTRPIALLVSDLMLPDMTGPALASRLEQLVPHVRVLYVSGYPAGVLDELREGHTEYDFLAKPFEPGALLARVRTVLDRNGAAAP